MKELPLAAQIASSKAGLGALISELGWISGMRAALASLPPEFGVDPFNSLGKAKNNREKASRKQIAGGVYLYRHLKKKLGKSKALNVMQHVIIAGTLAFLKQTIGEPPISEYVEASEPQRRKLIGAMIDRFFNATSEITRLDDEAFDVDVVACHFPVLCKAAEVPELAPLFCMGDLSYFNHDQSLVRLQREHTLAEGAAKCPFRFRLANRDSA